MPKIAKQIIGIVVVFGAINLVLWGAQEFYHREESSQIKETKKFLESEDRTIKALAMKIEEQERELNQEEIELNRYESAGQVDEYNRLVGSYNLTLSIYKSNINTYNSKIGTYNAKVNEANALIEQSGSRWYLLPIPPPGKVNHITN
ncbi:MAG: hypothetical protein A2748_02385 [Candidatus Wildermuthbacteria bacterium RIFCSPHIGHO2_01_FULL_45_20]|nr:MAG: hypothetical protein A3F22_00545 [Candidatus Magasanikbacteria bacterium RIFCSPHIGHO2_12_FULL_41_16]OHA63387.1 MAG: hypothetical protein A2748_02385 [Candidatus Wildermuthbacteria bacterium RIFCSPHIGHO2_01_FULL_45_20]